MLYHREVYWPFLPFQIGRIKLKYSAHALCAAQDEDIELPLFETIYDADIFELEQLEKRIRKFGVRIYYNQSHDLVLIICPPLNPKIADRHTESASGNWTVKTVWLQSREDNHKTLDHSRYTKG